MSASTLSPVFFHLLDLRRPHALRTGSCGRRCGGYLQCGDQRLRRRCRHRRSRESGAVFAPDGQLVGPYGFLAGHDALVKLYASFTKPGDKDVFTVASARMIGDVALCTGGVTFKPALGATESKGF
jgi:hypothetical protein